MSININSLKTGFIAYLEEISELTDKTYNTSSADISVFMYVNEFKNYISDELDVDPKILSMSINDILDLEIVNGKLVDPNSENEDISEEDALLQTDDAEDENNKSDLNNDISGFTDILNNLFTDKTVINSLDTDKDGELNEEEIQTFFNAIKGFDDNDENISLNDIITGLEYIQDGKNFLSVDNLPDENTYEVEQTEQPENTDSIVSPAGTSSGGGVSGGGGTSAAASGKTASQEPQEKTLENMSKEELNSELKTAESDLSSKQSALSDILSGSDPQIAALQEAVDENYEAYHDELEKVDEDMAKQLDELKTNIDDKEKEIDEKEQEISDQECTVSDCETAYNNAVTTRETLETSLSALESTDTSNMDDSKKAELSSKISELKSKIEDAKTAEDEAKTAWDEAEEKLTELQDEKEELQSGEGGLDELNEQMTELEQEIAEKYPEIKQYMDAYKDAKQEYTETKQEAITTAKAGILESQQYLNEIRTAISDVNNKENAKNYAGTDMNEDIVDFALQFMGYNAKDGSADIFVKGVGDDSSKVAWCSEFAKYVLQNSGHYDELASWYVDLKDKKDCGKNAAADIQKAASAAGAIVSADEAQPGDIILFDYDKDGTASHTGMVVKIENGVLYTIEGNVGNVVKQGKYSDIYSNSGKYYFCKVTQ